MNTNTDTVMICQIPETVMSREAVLNGLKVREKQEDAERRQRWFRFLLQLAFCSAIGWGVFIVLCGWFGI